MRTRAGRGPRTLAERDARFGQLLLAPTLLIVLVVVVLPILWTVVLAFQDLRLIDLRRRGLFGAFTLDNFAAVFGSPGFWTALRTTLLFSVVGTVVVDRASAWRPRWRCAGRSAGAPSCVRRCCCPTWRRWWR